MHKNHTSIHVMVAAVATLLAFAEYSKAQCLGDCGDDGTVTVDEIVIQVNIALGSTQLSDCNAGDADGNGEITIDEIITAVNIALNGCPVPAATPTSPPTVTVTATPTTTAISTNTPAATPTATLSETATATVTATPEGGPLSVVDVAARDASGVALLLNQTVTTEGIVTVSAGVFANNKLKIFLQNEGAAVMVYHQSSADVDAFQAGDRLRVTGIVRQQDPTSDNNPAIGTVAVDISHGQWFVVSHDEPLPDPTDRTGAEIQMSGTSFVGTLVRLTNVRKTEGNWPTVGSRSSQVMISDDGGTTQFILRFQRNTITPALVNIVQAIGDGPFTLTGVLLQDDGDNNGTLLSGFEIWVRGAGDVAQP